MSLATKFPWRHHRLPWHLLLQSMPFVQYEEDPANSSLYRERYVLAMPSCMC